MEGKKEKVKFSKEQLRFLGIFIGVIAVMVAVIWYDGFQSKNLILGLKDGESALASMIHYENLYWNNSEYKLRAVVFCHEHKIFVEDGKKYLSSNLQGCGYSLAENIEIEIRADIWKGVAYFRFIPITEE